MRTPGPCDDVGGMIRDGRRHRPQAAALLALLLALPGAAGVTAADPASAGLAERVARAQALVEAVRGVKFRAPVASALLPERELQPVLSRKLVEDLPVPFDTYAASLAAVGLVDPAPGLLDRLTRLYTRQVVGFYDPAEKKFYVVPERARDVAGPAGDLMEQLLLAHELTHAYQDERLGLDRRMRALRESTDALLALQAFLEGEATVLMTDALVRSVPEEAREELGSDPLSQVLDGLDSPDAVEGADGVPDFFVKELVFPYAAGTAWVRQKKAAGGWAAVDAAYASLPTTTREILRPGANLRPRRLLSPADRPGNGEPLGRDATRWHDTLGEWVLATLLERAGAGEEARPAAAAWQDDRIAFAALAGNEGRIGFLWRIRTTGPAAAKRIAAVLAPFYADRADGSRTTVRAKGDLVEVSLPLPPVPAS